MTATRSVVVTPRRLRPAIHSCNSAPSQLRRAVGSPTPAHRMDGVTEPVPVADGLDHSLDPRVIPLQQIGGALFTAALALGSLVGLFLADDIPLWLRVTLWLTFHSLALWHFYRWPA